MTVSAILKSKGRDVATAAPETTLLDIANSLTSRRIGAIVIAEPEGQVVGIISERDIVRAVAEHGPSTLGEAVSEFMTSPVLACGEDDSVAELMGVMTEHRIRHLPVLADGRLVGIVSIGDVVKARIAEAELEAEAMKQYITSG
ncbi:CBS domain-containing protein [Kaustia mangrovi]|uniref:CBS domain-containing protein n=1 Tax=Kaustia mangrovi TaxID=2593653 RepID=A0A7S8C0U4_9HYPH|nr:CBS domain-containing protein [Kaustia mangrovi]QPC41283.1 CBS domain-containing protein [Kaustia mangrovi]